MSDKKCRYIFNNLMNMLESGKGTAPSWIFVHELLEETPGCDKFHDLSDLRDAYSKKLAAYGADTEKHIREITSVTPDDEKISVVVVNHYNGWTQDRLSPGIGGRNWASCKTKYQSIAAIIGTATLGYVGYRLFSRF